FEIKVRGPFDIGERMFSLLLQSNHSTPSMQKTHLHGMNAPPRRVLLNPKSPDGCWDILFMICGGTGLAPMLQMVQYHYERNTQTNRSLHILFANATVDEIIDAKYLNELVAASNGTLTITHTLLHAPSENCEGSSGYINQKTLLEWISKHYTPKESTENITKKTKENEICIITVCTKRQFHE
ncbi:261_t:CDS:2, partial [Acaulospora morrowiae]